MCGWGDALTVHECMYASGKGLKGCVCMHDCMGLADGKVLMCMCVWEVEDGWKCSCVCMCWKCSCVCMCSCLCVDMRIWLVWAEGIHVYVCV